MIQIRKYNELDYKTIVEWLQEHGVAIIPHQMLPKLGVIAYDEETSNPVGAGWLYMDNSTGTALVAFPCVDPDACGRKKLEALNAVVGYLVSQAQENGYPFILSMSAVPSVSRLIEQHQFMVAATNATVLIKK